VVQSKAKTVDEYVRSLPADRREAVSAVRRTILKNLPEGFEEMMLWGMIVYGIPLQRFPDTYNKQPLGIAALASQKNYMSVYLMSVYSDKKTLAWFTKAYKASGKKLDMGKSCVRFRKLEDLPLDVIGVAIAKVTPEQLIAVHERWRGKKNGKAKPK